MSAARPLAGQHILVTRPAAQGDALRAGITRLGGQAWHVPLLAISALQEPDQREHCKQCILQLDQYQQVIFVSTNAVRYGVEWIEQFWPQLPVGIRWLGIGRSTCEALVAAGIPVALDFPAGHPMNSEALLAEPGLQVLAAQKILIVKGVGGRETLQTVLQQRGARVDTVNCYQRGAPSVTGAELLDLLRSQHIGTICINSGDTLENLLVLLGADYRQWLGLHLVVPSERVALLARDKGFTHITRAANASDEAVLVALADAQTQ